jgi:UDP-N-acetylmuramyl tripeptide synthase
VLGKGHETTQETAGRVVDFDDANYLLKFLQEKFGK